MSSQLRKKIEIKNNVARYKKAWVALSFDSIKRDRTIKIANFFINNPAKEFTTDEINWLLFSSSINRHVLDKYLQDMSHFLTSREGCRSYISIGRKITLFKLVSPKGYRYAYS